MPNPNPDTPHVDFALPGWVITPPARLTCLLSLATAYSRKWNPRNLEHPWYEPWARILQALVADLPSLAVAPQSYLWYYRHSRPGDHHIEPPFARDEDDWLEEADTTLDSIGSIHVAPRRNKYQLVDFAITRKVSRDRPPTLRPAYTPEAQFYVSRKVEYMGIPVLCELKRGGMYCFLRPTSMSSNCLCVLQPPVRPIFVLVLRMPAASLVLRLISLSAKHIISLRCTRTKTKSY